MNMLDSVRRAMADFQPFHSIYQIDEFIVRGEAATLWGAYKNVQRNIHVRLAGIAERMRKLEECETEFAADDFRLHILDLARELHRLCQWEETLRPEAELTVEERHRLDQDEEHGRRQGVSVGWAGHYPGPPVELPPADLVALIEAAMPRERLDKGLPIAKVETEAAATPRVRNLPVQDYQAPTIGVAPTPPVVVPVVAKPFPGQPDTVFGTGPGQIDVTMSEEEHAEFVQAMRGGVDTA